MTIADIKTILSSVQGFENAVAFRAFPEKQTPPLPFIVFADTGVRAFHADNVNYYVCPTYTIELHERVRDPATELLVEAKLTSNGLTFDRIINYDSAEKCWTVSYDIITKGE
ncbi:MAG: hypothetical protein IJG87_02310 [Ruminococcus sp.]|nr:hypothetical protein [Ruminococcus sp.]